jgi:L-ascorbate metabolism protein UlaG (beta-lactamase superfamily)
LTFARRSLPQERPVPSLTHIDTACTLLEIGGWRLVTDPVFDPPGRRYWFGWGSSSRKLEAPALTAGAVGEVDAVLLSHHQHGDNLDRAGRAFAEAAPVVISTRTGARQFARGVGLASGETYTLRAPGRDDLVVTAMPARHRPAWVPGFISGPAIGFHVSSPELPGPLQITGDTTLTDALRASVIGRGVDTLVVHVGAVKFPYLSGPARFTFNAAEALELAQLADARRVIAVHTSGWTHFREGPAALRAAFEAAGLGDRLVIPTPGEPIDLS